jgi:hypothetical protein
MVRTVAFRPTRRRTGGNIEQDKQKIILSTVKRVFNRNILIPPVIMMIIANLVPLAGILFLGWNAFAIVSLYWIETIIIGFFAILRFMFAPTEQISLKKKLVGVPVFSWFLGWFLSGYGVAIIFLFIIFANRNIPQAEWSVAVPDGDYYQPSWPGPLGLFELGIDTIRIMYHILPSKIIVPVILLAISHIYSFVDDYFIKKGQVFKNFKQIAEETGIRIFAFHFSIMIGGFLMAIFLSNIPILVCLVIFKCCVDVKMYLTQGNKAGEMPMPDVMRDFKLL